MADPASGLHLVWLDARLRAHAADRPDAPALTDARGRLTWSALDAQVDAWAAALIGAGVGPGDVMALWLPKGRAVLLAHLGALRMGAVSLPMNPRATVDEAAHVLATARPTLVLHARERERDVAAALASARVDATTRVLGPHDDAPVTGGGRGAIEADAAGRPTRAQADSLTPEADVAAADALPPEADAALITTSGTTGRPKAARLTRGNLAAQTASLLGAWELTADDVLLHVLPLFHVHGLFVAAHTALAAGARVLLRDAFDADETWATLTAGDATVLMAVPTIHGRLLSTAPSPAPRLPALRLVTSGSAPLPAATMTRLAEVYGQPPLERYGLTEAGMVCGNPLRGERRPGTVGLDLPGVTTRLMDVDTGAPAADGAEGEVQLRSPSVFAGYLGLPDATAETFTADGWLRTGDVGRRDEAGHLVLSGRLKELLLVGGFNVYPAELEAVLADLPGLAEVAAFGLPDDDLGEVPALAIVPAPGADAAALTEAVTSRCRERLAAYKCPRRVALVDELPRNAMGKLLRARLPEASGLG